MGTHKERSSVVLLLFDTAAAIERAKRCLDKGEYAKAWLQLDTIQQKLSDGLRNVS